VSEVKTFFRHCPSCGRRFEIRLQSKSPVDSQVIVENQRIVQPVPQPMRFAVVEENIPFVDDIEEFQYTYRCKHCGHQWSEIREQERMMKQPEGYTGD
jgi:C4-type Zn-finger protein